MTRKDNAYDLYDDDLMPEQTNYTERILLFGAGLLATAGFAGFAVSRLPEVAALAPTELATLPHLLGGSIFAFGLGAGAFTCLFGLFTNVATVGQLKKVASVYVPVVGLVSLLVDAGAFHPRLAFVFICFLCAFGVVYTLFHGTRSLKSGRKNI